MPIRVYKPIGSEICVQEIILNNLLPSRIPLPLVACDNGLVSPGGIWAVLGVRRGPIYCSVVCHWNSYQGRLICLEKNHKPLTDNLADSSEGSFFPLQVKTTSAIGEELSSPAQGIWIATGKVAGEHGVSSDTEGHFLKRGFEDHGSQS